MSVEKGDGRVALRDGELGGEVRRGRKVGRGRLRGVRGGREK